MERGVPAGKITKLVELVGKKTGIRVTASKIHNDLVVSAMNKGKAAARVSGLSNITPPAGTRPQTAFFWDVFKKGYSIKKFPEATKAMDYITMGGSKQAIREGLAAGFSPQDIRQIVAELVFGRKTGRGLN